MRAILFSLFLTITLAAAAGFVGVLAGRSLADAPAEYERGVEEGERLGAARAKAAFRAGEPAYDAVVEQARTEGYERGRREGSIIGAERGRRRGRASAFAGFEGGWDVGRWYVITLEPGGNDGTDLRIGTRVPLRRGQWYGLCDESSGLCRRTTATTRRTGAPN